MADALVETILKGTGELSNDSAATRTISLDLVTRRSGCVASTPRTGELVAMDAKGRCFRGTIEITTPTGHSHTTRPPALVTIRRRELPPLTIDFLLTG